MSGSREQVLAHLGALVERAREGTGDSDRHLLLLFGAALGSRGRTFLELGVRNGSSTLPLLLAAHLVGGRLISVDLQPTSFVCPPELAPHWTFVQSDAVAFLEAWDPATRIDFALVDDWHAYPHVKKELDLLRRLVTPSGVLFLHDLMYAGAEPRYHTNRAMDEGEWAHGGPYRAVAELPRRDWEWATFPWNNGMTLVRRKDPRLVSEGRYVRRFFPGFWRRLDGPYRALRTLFRGGDGQSR